MKAALRGTELYFDISGMQLAPHGKKFIERPILFLLHGGPGGDHLRFKQHSLGLHDVAQLVFIDHRGCGRSKKTKQKDYTLENNIEDVEALRKHLGLKKINLLGTSYGGMVAQGYAIRYPHRLEKLILVATAPSYRFLAEAKNYLHQHGTPKQIALAEKLWSGKFRGPQQLKNFLQLMDPVYSVKARKGSKTKINHSLTRYSHEALNEAFSGFLRQFDFIPKLQKISVPTLVLAGQEDWICSPKQSEIIVNKIPHAKLKIFKNCGHSIAVDAQDQYINIIKKFIKKKS